MSAVLAAAAVALVAVPVIEFGINYVRAPLAIQLDELRVELERSRTTPALPSVGLRLAPPQTSPSSPPSAVTEVLEPERLYVRESSLTEILERLADARWSERDLIYKNSYHGQWFHGEAYVESIASTDRVVLVCLSDVGKGGVIRGVLDFPIKESHRIKNLESGDRVAFEAQIKKAGVLTVDMNNATIILVKENYT